MILCSHLWEKRSCKRSKNQNGYNNVEFKDKIIIEVIEKCNHISNL